MHRVLRLATILCLALPFLPVFPGLAAADHPFLTDDPFVLGKGNVRVELAYDDAHFSAGRNTRTVSNTYALGISDRVDLGFKFTYLFKEDPRFPTAYGRGMGDTQAVFRAQLLRQDGLVPTLALKAGAKLPTGDPVNRLRFGTGRADGLAAVIAGWQAGPAILLAKAGTHIAGRPIGSVNRDDQLSLAVGGLWMVREGAAIVSDYHWKKNLGASGPAVSEYMIGGKMGILPNVMIDAGLRWGTTSATQNVTYLAGVTMDFCGGKECRR